MNIQEFVENNVILNVSNFLSRIEESDELFLESCEQWVVSEYLGRQLKNKGEIVESFCGHTIWGRKTSGQAIYMDSIIKKIYEGK